MTITVLLILGALWAAVLLPPVLRSRSEGRRGDRIGPLDFRLGARRSASMPGLTRVPALGGRGPYRPSAFPARGLGASTNVAPRPPGEMTPAQKRRRDVLLVLLGAAALTLLLAVFTGLVIIWVLHVVVDLLLGTYVFLLVQVKQRTLIRPVPVVTAPSHPVERRRQLRHVPHPAQAPRREVALPRTGAP